MHLLRHHAPQVRPSVRIERLVQLRLRALASRVRIVAAEVRLAPSASDRRFRASVLLRVPGPDVHATASDHTLRGAVARSLAAAESQLTARSGRGRAARHPGAAAGLLPSASL